MKNNDDDDDDDGPIVAIYNGQQNKKIKIIG